MDYKHRDLKHAEATLPSRNVSSREQYIAPAWIEVSVRCFGSGERASCYSRHAVRGVISGLGGTARFGRVDSLVPIPPTTSLLSAFAKSATLDPSLADMQACKPYARFHGLWY